MSALKNPRHEQFAQLCAGGKSHTESYALCGYSSEGAASSAHRLSKKADVAARIAELQQVVAEATITRAVIDRDWVLQGLRAIATDTKASDSARVRAYELMGKERGMFIDRNITAHVPTLADISKEELEKELEKARATMPAELFAAIEKSVYGPVN